MSGARGRPTAWALRATAALFIAAPLYLILRSAIFVYGIHFPRPALAAVALAVAIGLVAALVRTRTKRGAFALVLLALCGGLLGSLLPPVRDHYLPIEVVATGERNPLSAGTEVWLPDVVPGRVFFGGDGWERRDGQIAVSYQDQPNTARLIGHWRPGQVLRLPTHRYSGIAVVRIGGVEQRVDLYSATEGSLTVALPNPETSRWGRSRWLLYAVLPVLALLALGVVINAMPRPWRMLTLTGVVLATATMAHLAGRSYPGPLELLAYGSGELAQIDAGIGRGMFDLPLGGAPLGRSEEYRVTAEPSQPLHVSVATGALHAIGELGRANGMLQWSSRGREALCPHGQALQLFEWLGDKSGALRVSAGEKAWTFSAERDTAKEQGARTFVVARCAGTDIVLYRTNAYVNISPWTLPYYRTRELRALDRAGKPLPVLQLSGENPVGFVSLQRASDGSVAGPFQFDRSDTRAFALEKMIAAGLVGLIPFLVWIAASNVRRARRHWMPGRRAVVAVFYLLPPVWIAATMVVQWPGTIGWDAFSPYIQMHTGTLFLWYGVGYPLVIGALTQLVSPPVVAVLQCIVMALLIQTVALRCLDAGTRGALWIGVAICAALPLTIIALGATVHLRDAMNGTLVAAFAVGWFYTTVDSRARSTAAQWPIHLLLGLMATALVLLRVDNLVLIGVIMACGPWLQRRPRTGALGYSLSVLLACLFANAAVERVVFGQTEHLVAEKNIYKETAVINPLVGFLVDPDSRIPSQEKAALARDLAPMLNVEHAAAHWRPFHIIWWHEASKDKPPPSTEATARLQRHFVRMVALDPLRFLHMRTALFVSMLGHRSIDVPPAPPINDSSVLLDRLRMAQDREAQAVARLLGFSPERRFMRATSDRLFKFYNDIGTTVPQLLICIVLVACVRWVPVAGVVALGLLARAGVFFLLAPADVFLYLFDMHIMGVLLPGMAAYEISKRRPSGRAPVGTDLGRHDAGRGWSATRRGADRSGLQ